jgi:hypothetical protein
LRLPQVASFLNFLLFLQAYPLVPEFPSGLPGLTYPLVPEFPCGLPGLTYPLVPAFKLLNIFFSDASRLFRLLVARSGSGRVTFAFLF